jgi:tRNA dimethylallyltransferase
MTKPKIIAIVGPTAAGKSDLAVAIAKLLHGEIISADSRQVYRGLDIGSGKITTREMKGIPHHLLDVADPKRTYSVSRFQRDGRKAIRSIVNQGKLPIVVGGTGFYIDALLFDMQLPSVKADAQLRKKLEKLSTEELCAQLATKDPRRFEAIDKKNRVRLIRALEIALLDGPVAPITMNSLYDIYWIGIRADNELLKERIALRLTKRLKQGMIAEFKKLNEEGLSLRRMEMLGLEYRYGARLLQNLITKEEFTTQLNSEILKYAKRQMTWFKRNKHIHWIDVAKNPQHIVEDFLGTLTMNL